jgi:hypothetical protein
LASRIEITRSQSIAFASGATVKVSDSIAESTCRLDDELRATRLMDRRRCVHRQLSDEVLGEIRSSPSGMSN